MPDKWRRHMNLKGYANRIAHVDMTTQKIEMKPIPEDWARKYIGARGLGVRYMLEAGFISRSTFAR